MTKMWATEAKSQRWPNIYLVNEPGMSEGLIFIRVRVPRPGHPDDNNIRSTLQTQKIGNTSELQTHAVVEVEIGRILKQERERAQVWMAGDDANKQERHVYKNEGSQTLHTFCDGLITRTQRQDHTISQIHPSRYATSRGQVNTADVSSVRVGVPCKPCDRTRLPRADNQREMNDPEDQECGNPFRQVRPMKWHDGKGA